MENNKTKHYPKPVKTFITLNNHNYSINANFSMDDLQEYFNDMLATDSHKALCNLIFKNLEKENNSNPPDLNDFYNENENVFQPYIDSLISQNLELNDFYLNTSSSMQISERFEIATQEYFFNQYKKFAKKIQTSFDNQCHKSKAFNIEMQKEAKKSLELYNTQIDKYVEKAKNTISLLLASISTNLPPKDLPYYTEKQQQDLIKSCEYWGKHGWSILPNVPISFFYEKPSSQKDCDNIALEYLGEKTLDNVFSNLLNLDLNKNDIESAIFCFKNKQFKACSLLLFSMIDSYLIEDQKNVISKGFKVGKVAVSRFENRFKEKHKDEEQLLYIILCLNNISKCLQTFFSNANDFKNEPCVINRNFVCHGMSKKHIQKKDCIQLFLALYNIFELSAFYE